MKLPNKYGSISKLSGNRRKPYMVRICDGVVYDEQIGGYKVKRAILGYYATRKEALTALAEYNNNPFNIQDASITFGQIYDRWKQEKYYQQLSESAKTSRESALKYCAPIMDMKIKDIKTATLQDIIDACPHGSSTKKNIRTVMHTVFEYAVQNDLVSRDYTDFIKIEYSEPVIDREIFSEDEIKKLWDMSDKWEVQILLILLYSGLRVNELLKNNRENCNLEERWIYVPESLAKNRSSIRYVPIHDKVYDFVQRFYMIGEKYNSKGLIVNDGGYVITYNNFVSRNLKKINQALGSNHKMHDTRHTFITRAHTFKLDDLCLKKIVGHTPGNITQKVYTHITIEELRKEINKMA